MHHFKRRAFTLVELVVVIFVITLLLAFLVPGVMKLRSMSNRSACQMNLKRLGMAMTSYYEMNDCFPAAWKGPDNHPGWGWSALLLPHLGQKDLYDSLGVGIKQFGDGALRAQADEFTQRPLAEFRCPDEGSGPINTQRFNHALSNYQAVWGTGNSGTFVANQDRGGVMFQNSRTDFNDIPDGASNTFLVGETTYDEGLNQGGNIWAGMSGTGVTVRVETYTQWILVGWWWWWDWWGWDWGWWWWPIPIYEPVTITYVITTYTTTVSDVAWWLDSGDTAINGTSSQAFRSRHSGGANFLFCDATVRFIRQGGDLTVAASLANRRDGVVATPWDD